MNEAGLGIISHSASMKVKGRPAEGGKIAFRQPDVDRLAKNMQAAGSYLAISFAQIGIGDGASISGDDVERLIRLQFDPQGIQKVKKGKIDRADLIGTVVTQNAMDFSDGLREIISGSTIRNLQGFPRVGIVKGKNPFRGRGSRSPAKDDRGEKEETTEPAAESPALRNPRRLRRYSSIREE